MHGFRERIVAETQQQPTATGVQSAGATAVLAAGHRAHVVEAVRRAELPRRALPGGEARRFAQPHGAVLSALDGGAAGAALEGLAAEATRARLTAGAVGEHHLPRATARGPRGGDMAGRGQRDAERRNRGAAGCGGAEGRERRSKRWVSIVDSLPLRATRSVGMPRRWDECLMALSIPIGCNVWPLFRWKDGGIIAVRATPHRNREHIRRG